MLAKPPRRRGDRESCPEERANWLAILALDERATGREMLWLARHGPASARLIVASRPDAPAKAMEWLAQDPDGRVRRAALRNKDAPESVRALNKLEEM